MKRMILTGLLLMICFSAAAEKQPNILFILADDLRNDSLGCAGHPHIRTPNIDRLAERGVRFENMFVNTPICMASRATIFTGLTQTSLLFRPSDPQGSLPVSEEDLARSFPTLLRDAGYHAGYFGKNHVEFADGKREAFDRMFNDWKHFSRNPYFKELPDGSKRHTDELMGDQAVAFLKERPRDKPFMLYMSFNISHAEDKDHRPGIGHFPWPQAEDGLYEEVEPPRPKLDDPGVFEALPEFLKSSMNRKRYLWRWDTPEKYRINMRALYRMITGMDRIIGRALAVLEEQGALENTIIIFTADNGYYMGERGLAGKWSHFEESLRVPLIIADPRQSEGLRGRVVKPMACNIDLPSTMLDAAGLPVPKEYQGVSLLPIVAGDEPDDRRGSLYVEHHQLRGVIPGWVGVRDQRYVYARYDRQDPPYEFLHDLERDPRQLINFANDPEYREILERLRSRTDQQKEQYTRPETMERLRGTRQQTEKRK